MWWPFNPANHGGTSLAPNTKTSTNPFLPPKKRARSRSERAGAPLVSFGDPQLSLLLPQLGCQLRLLRARWARANGSESGGWGGGGRSFVGALKQVIAC